MKATTAFFLWKLTGYHVRWSVKNCAQPIYRTLHESLREKDILNVFYGVNGRRETDIFPPAGDAYRAIIIGWGREIP